jgi:hypothetical protein
VAAEWDATLQLRGGMGRCRFAKGRTCPRHDDRVTPVSNDKAAALLGLHTGPGFVLPNAWDAGSARMLEQVGFPAIATTSRG